jgi:flavorubredoxin
MHVATPEYGFPSNLDLHQFMKIRKITDRVSYTGVNDRATVRFEGLWPLPYGVSYNAYLVKGSSACALIDSVELGHSREFMDNIHEMLDVEKIDYLVVNHMEPDHSGGIPRLLEAFPDIKIIGNAKTIQMIQGFYHIDNPDNFMEVKDGAEVQLGDRTLRFIMTPMVHWPETMMTYCPEERVIFSGDAFGTFGALNGGIIDDDLDCGLYIEEMYRYYSNIVGKYGRFVNSALQKITGLEIDYICSTHGPVWHSHIDEVGAIVHRLANYQPEKGVTIIYGSMYGNTADVAECFATTLNELGIRNIRIHNAGKSEMSDMISDAFRYEGLIVGSPTYSNDVFPPVQAFLNAMKTREIKHKVVASFGNCAWAPMAAKSISTQLATLELTDAGTVAMKQSITPEVEAQVRSVAKEFVNLLTLK